MENKHEYDVPNCNNVEIPYDRPSDYYRNYNMSSPRMRIVNQPTNQW